MTNRVFSARLSSRSTAKIKRRFVVPDDGYNTPKYMINQSIVPQPYVLRKGFPYAPAIHVTSDAYISTEGYFDPENTYPWDSIYGDGEAHSRFIALSDFWDDIGALWNPIITNGINYWFTWSGTIVPRLENIEYRIDKALYQVDSIRIPEGASLTSSFNNGMDDASSFIIAMAGMINSVESASLIRIGDTPSTAIEVLVDEFFTVKNQYGSARLNVPKHPSAMTPIYVLLINDATSTELRVASGTARSHSIKIPNQQTVRNLTLFIGEDLAGTKSLDLNLFEVSIFPYGYGGGLSPEQIIMAMASVYGSGR